MFHYSKRDLEFCTAGDEVLLPQLAPMYVMYVSEFFRRSVPTLHSEEAVESFSSSLRSARTSYAAMARTLYEPTLLFH